MTRHPTPFCSLDEVIVEPCPVTLAQSAAVQASESEAFLELSRTLAEAPQLALQRYVELALEGTRADSAGISLEECDAQGPFFRWIATAGEFTRYVNGTMPREFSPCGATVDAGRSLIMRDPARYYAYASQLEPPVHMLLVVPFRRGGKTVGTVWVAAHGPDKSFTSADQRFVENLGGFASDVLDSTGH